MRIAVVGGGPSGLYFAALMKASDPGHEITVLERNPADATFGWGVVFSEETLGAFRDADFETYTRITDTFARWGAIDVRYRGETIRSRGHVFSAIARKRLLAILQGRCAQLGVELRFEHEFDAVRELDGYDLVVGADGVRSTVRNELAAAFRPSEDVHGTRYIWFGTDLVFDAFTFIFRESDHGLFQVHGYPFDAGTSTFIVECPEKTWRRAGLDGATEAESIAYCEALFAEDLAGHRLMSNRSAWINFVTLRCETWHAGNVVLMGDAAHTAHFTIGSGTKLAMEDAIGLAEAFQRHPVMERALLEYEMGRQPVVERFQEAARESAQYFEDVRRYADFDPVQFSFNLLTRSGRITHLELEKRDAAFVRRVDGGFAAAGGPASGAASRLVTPPPLFAPIRLRGLELGNRVALSPRSPDDAADGVPGPDHADRLVAAAHAGAALVMTGLVAVSPEGRVSPGTPGLYDDRQALAWSEIVDRVHAAGAAVCLQLGHAGARGATRSRRDGVDRPLREGAWPLLAASEIRYTKLAPVAEAIGPDGMAGLIDGFARAAGRAATAGFDVLEVHLAQGYLLGGFLSPLTNRREDGYGGPLESRARFPLEVVGAVRASWPGDRPMAAALLASDWARGGFGLDDAVAVARMLREHGCDLIRPLAGQTTVRDVPVYGRFYLVPASDRIRNEARIPTLVGGNLTTNDEINTILAAGRADLCLLEPGA